MLSRWKRLARPHTRRISAGLVLVAYLGALFGFPAPAAQAKDGRPVSCQGHACACQTSDKCCCCNPGDSFREGQEHKSERPCCKKKNAAPIKLILSPMRCKGASMLWVSAGIVLPPPVRLTWNPNLSVVDRLTHHDSGSPGIESIPPEPPPRLSL